MTQKFLLIFSASQNATNRWQLSRFFVKRGCRLRHSPVALQLIFSSLFGQFSATGAFLWMVSKGKFPRSSSRKNSPMRNFKQKRDLIFEIIQGDHVCLQLAHGCYSAVLRVSLLGKLLACIFVSIFHTAKN